MKKFFFAALIVVHFTACKPPQTTSAVGLQTLNNYILRTDVVVTQDVWYMYFSDATPFNNTFQLSRSSPGNVVVPDFDGQRVVAIAQKSSTNIIDIKFRKAEAGGKDLNVYYEVITSPGTNYPHSPFTVAIIPKNSSVKRINFYKGDTKEKTINIE